MSSGDPFEPTFVIRPRIGRKAPPTRDQVPTFRGQLLRAIQRHGGWRSRGGPAGRRRGSIAVREPHARSRRCVVKARYVSMSARGIKAARLHLGYLERDGVERDGSPGRLYGADEEFAADAFRTRLENEQRQFRFIVSPEDGDSLDLKEFARQFMKQVERDTGRPLIWAAVNHYNTANPHVHIVIRGLDRDGDDVRIDRQYISHGMRWRAQEILTQELGLQSDFELEQRCNADIERHGFTPIDRMLARYVRDDGRLEVGQLADALQPERAACLARLEVLAQLKLARKLDAGAWWLEEGWETRLIESEERAEAIERAVKAIPSSRGRCHLLAAGSVFARFEGVVKAIGLHDEQTGEMYMVVEGKGGVGYYVPVRPEVAEALRIGEKLAVGSAVESWVKASDQRIARFARDNGGVYDSTRHQVALEAVQRRSPGQAGPTPAQLVGANTRRLQRLERYGLAQHLGAGRWHVPVDLVAQLQAREMSHPRHRIEIVRLGPERTPARKGPEISR
jgi:type IV secretory pathway VirD2 relaxase